MVGLLTWSEPRKGHRRVEVRERMLLHLRLLQAETVQSQHPAILRRRVLAAGKQLRKQGAVRVVLPEAFPFDALLDKCGLRPMSTLALRRSLASDWVRVYLAEQGLTGAQVAVSAAILTGEVVRTVTELALRHRYVLLDLPYGGEELCRQLRREYGVSVQLGPAREQLEEAEVLVLFDPRTDLAGGNPVLLRLYDENAPLPPLALPPAVEEQLPPGVRRDQLTAALREAGVLRREQITLLRTAPLAAAAASLYPAAHL